MRGTMHIVYQMLEFLPDNVKSALAYVNRTNVYEIRLRANRPITANYLGKYVFLGERGITERAEKAIICNKEDIEDCLFRAGKYSVYAVEEQIRKGFLTAEHGERIGIAGEYVFERGQPLTIRNVTSLCVRVPHEVVGCAEEIYQRCMCDKIKNLLIASKPGMGKTTILRDFGRIISEKTRKNVLICDERGEISLGDTGNACDVLKFADKATAFDLGIRTMRPDVIITDELSETDCTAIKKAIYAGVIVLASVHLHDISSLQAPLFGLFDRYVFLDGEEIGKIKCVYNEKGEEV